MEKPSEQLCVYCQVRPADTIDHVIARAFFGDHQPEIPVKVPSCRECNQGRGDGGPRPITMDEEYARTVFASELTASRHEVADNLLNGAILRSFKNSERFLHRIAGSIEHKEVRNPAGIILPHAALMHADLNRVGRVLTKITRGLYYAGGGKPLPRTTPISGSPPISIEKARKVMTDVMDRCPVRTDWIRVGAEGAFYFKAAKLSENNAVFLLIFYQSLVFCTSTIPAPQAQ